MQLITSKPQDIFYNNKYIYYCTQNTAAPMYVRCNPDTLELSELGIEEYLNAKSGEGQLANIDAANFNTISVAIAADIAAAVSYQDDRLQLNYRGELKLVTGINWDVYGLALGKDMLWLCATTHHSLIALNYSGEVVQTIGNADYGAEKGDIFTYPESVFYDNQQDLLYVTDMGSKSVLVVDPNTKAVSNYRKFDETVWNFFMLENKEFVLLDSGLYAN
jgi:DNA-binding beta-propeller fold protein YncE